MHSEAGAWPLGDRAESWGPRSIPCVPVYGAGSWGLWLAETCTGVIVGSGSLKVACLLVGCVPTPCLLGLRYPRTGAYRLLGQRRAGS